MILSAQERADDHSARKTRNERRMEPAFDVCIELTQTNQWRVHQNIARAVDVVLRQLGEVCNVQVRELKEDGTLEMTTESFPTRQDRDMLSRLPDDDGVME